MPLDPFQEGKNESASPGLNANGPIWARTRPAQMCVLAFHGRYLRADQSG